MKFKKVLCYALACFVALAALSPVGFASIQVYAANYSDISGHWAESYINSAISRGITTGYSDGTFQPNKPVTRAEFASMMNKALKNSGTASMSFTDVPSSQWYYSDVSKAVAAAYVSGYDNNSFKPNDPITREEAAVMIARIVPTTTAAGNLNAFADRGSISSWALTAMQKSNQKGYLGAYSDGNLHPKDKLTRAQTVKIICDILDQETIITDTSSVDASGTTLAGKIYSNGVIINKNFGENSAAIKNCVVMGDLTIQGGGIDSLIISNSRIARCSIAGASVTLENGTIDNLEVSPWAANSKVAVDGSSTVITANVNGAATFYGSGTVRTMNAYANNITYETEPSVINVGSGVTTEPKKIGAMLSVNFDPADGEKDVAVNKTITITFSQPIMKYNGKAITSSDLKDLIQYNKDNKTGEAVAFSASISSSNKVITITPDNNLTKGVKYYISFDKDIFKDGNENRNKAQSISFTAGSGFVNGVTFDPAKSAEGASKTVKPTISFEKAVEKYSGGKITASYLANKISFRKENSSGSLVGFSAAINNNANIITITPTSELAAGQKYYLGFEGNVFQNDSDDAAIGGQSVTWTVGSAVVPVIRFNPSNGATGIKASSNMTISFSEKIFNESGSAPSNLNVSSSVSFRDDTAGSGVSYTPYIYYSENGSTIFAINPIYDLIAGHNYTVSISANRFKNSDGNYAAAASASFTVVTSTDVAELNKAISHANNTKEGTLTSIDGSDVHSSVYWVTVAQMTDLNNAITAATSALSTVQSTADAKAAAAALESAVSNFEKVKKQGTKISVDTSDIDQALRGAELLRKGTVVSVDGMDVDPTVKWVTKEEMKALDDAVNKAKEKKATVRTSEEVTQVVLELNWASVKLFDLQKRYGLKGTVDKSRLADAINKANRLKESTIISNDGSEVPVDQYWATRTEVSALAADIGAAERTLSNTSAEMEEVNRAVEDISAVTAEFSNSVRKSGLKAGE